MSPAAFIFCHMKLSEMKPGERARVTAVAEGNAGARLGALGVAAGATVECLYCHPSGDPVAYRVGETVVAMRRKTASRISVTLF